MCDEAFMLDNPIKSVTGQSARALGMKDIQRRVLKQQMPVCEASMANAKTKESFDISSSHWHLCSDQNSECGCYPTADSIIPARS
ncbi:hypothetical protein TNCV_3314051 [Trichonephila clavipes]|nr:hypothetical protein TNCV_3314051 [Trichonephila clavipes]